MIDGVAALNARGHPALNPREQALWVARMSDVGDEKSAKFRIREGIAGAPKLFFVKKINKPPSLWLGS